MEDDDLGEDGGHYERMLGSMDSISAAFRVGALSKDLKICGLVCPKIRVTSAGGRPQCETCLRLCRSLPLESVVNFESRGSSKGKALAKRPYAVDVCLSREQIEFVVETRPGGAAMLKSQGRVLQLLGSGSRYEVVSDEGASFIVVKYKQAELDEIVRVIQYTETDLKKLSEDEVVGAIMKSFATNEDGPVPDGNKCYLSEVSYDGLTELKIPLPEKDIFYRTLDNNILLKHLPQLACVVEQRLSFNTEYRDIEIDTLRLIRRLLEIEQNPPIQQIVSRLSLVQGLIKVRYPVESLMEAATSLKIILARGTVEHRKILMDANITSTFMGLLHYLAGPQLLLAVEGLVHIVNGGSNDTIEELVRLRATSYLVRVLGSKQDGVIEGSLNVLAAIAKGHTKEVIDEGTLPHVLRILNESDNVGILSNASALLSTIIEARDRGELPLQTNTIPRIIELMNTYPDSEVLQTNLAGVAFALSSNSNALSDALVEAGFVPILCNLLHSLDDDIVKRAVVAVGRIADNTLSHRELALKEGVVSSLLGLLEYSSEVSTLRVLGICLRGKSSVADATEGLNVLLKLLVNEENEEVAASTCVALFNLLNGLDSEELKQVGAKAMISTELVKPLLELLQLFNHDGQGAAIKCVHLLTKMGEKFIESIESGNGLSMMNELLLSDRSTHETIEVACSIVSNILAGNPSQIRVAIDLGMIARLVAMLSSSQFRVKKSALDVVHQLVGMSDSSDHIEYLVSRDIVKPLCELLYSDCKVANMAIEALQSVSAGVCLLSD